jgi:AraC family transcriptional regulator
MNHFMGFSPQIQTLARGAFFGNPFHVVTTPSFQFSGLQATLPEREVPLHTHKSPHLVMVLGGVYRTEARNGPGDCFPGTLIFNPAETTHRDCFRSDHGSFLSITPGAEVSRLLERAAPVPLLVSDSEIGFDESPPIAHRIAKEMQLQLEDSHCVLEGLGLELIALLAQIQEKPFSPSVPGWLWRIREMIHDCDGLDLTIAELAAAERVHPVYLARAYRRYFRCSPGEHLRHRRLLRTQGLLSGTDLPLVEIALQCGFSDQSQMTRSFSRKFGMPPARYRLLHRK